MALVDLLSDLSKFKGDTSPKSIDDQKEASVTLKTDLESLYKNTGPADMPPVKSSNMYVPDIPKQSFDDTSKAFGAHGSPLVATPISTYVSGYEPPEDTTDTFLIKSKPSDKIDFKKFSSGFTSVGGGVVKYANIKPMVNRISMFGNDVMSVPPSDYFYQQITHNIPAITSRATAEFNAVGSSANYHTQKNLGPFSINLTPYDIDWGSYETDGVYSGVNTLVNKSTLDRINQKSLFKDKQFANVPAGLGLRNIQILKPFREVADPNTVEYARQPFILRPMGSNWDSVLTESAIGGTIGGVLEGALSVFGLLTKSSRNIADKARIFKYLISPKGIGFVAKQFGMQLLNPTLESKWFNPLSTLGIAGASDLLSAPLSGLLQAAASFILPVSHVERHFGGKRYENVVTILDKDGRLAQQSKAFKIAGSIERGAEGIQSNTGIGFLDRAANNVINDTVSGTIAAAIALPFSLSNPNKYAFLISSAPKSVHNGRVSFTGGPDLAAEDVRSALEKQGGTFNKESSVKDNDNRSIMHSVKAYHDLKMDKDGSGGYEKRIMNRPINPNAGLEGGDFYEDEFAAADKYENDKKLWPKTKAGINHGIGTYGGNQSRDPKYELGTIRGNVKTSNVDKINVMPYGGGLDFEQKMEDNPDFIKFRFKDKINNKYIIFRAILEGISDAISPEYAEERYIGRPDKVYVYQGADRNISFTFSIFPKTKQELPVLMEKLNYLVGLCYPSYTKTTERMKSPLMELTIGDMFNKASGILMGLTVTVEDTSTWELDEGLQFPHYIKAACEFRYIGDDILATTGKHYGLDWVPDGRIKRFDWYDLGIENIPHPNRKTGNAREMFSELGQAKYGPKLDPELVTQ